MKPRLAFVVSGPAACAMCAPNGNSLATAAIRAPVPADFRSARRLTPVLFVLLLMAVVSLPLSLVRIRPARFPVRANKKSRSPKCARKRVVQELRHRLLVHRWTNSAIGGCRRSILSLQIACQVAGAEMNP